MPAMKKNREQSSPEDMFEKPLQELDPANPIEFQLPDWLKRKKPLNYTTIRRNVYLTKRIKKRTEDDGIFCFCSPLSSSSSVCGRDCQCGMLLSSCSASCKCGNSCLNKPFQNRQVKKMKLVKVYQRRRQSSRPAPDPPLPSDYDSSSSLDLEVISTFLLLFRKVFVKDALLTPHWKKAMDIEMEALIDRGTWELCDLPTEKCGYGLVADEDIKLGEFVIEYVGEVIDDKTCEERLWDMKHRGETNFYLCEINRDMVIDATYKGNKSRYINHSCQPNTEMQKWRIDGETRIGIFATRDIKKGEDLTYDYRFVQFGADQYCHCGALGCRRKLGSKPSKPKLCSSDAALKLVACEVAAAASSPIMKALLMQKQVHDYPTQRLDIGCSHHIPCQRRACLDNCIGEMIQIQQPDKDRIFLGAIRDTYHISIAAPRNTLLYLKIDARKLWTFQWRSGTSSNLQLSCKVVKWLSAVVSIVSDILRQQSRSV
ncbi:histone-lysine N-methyltransferase ASHH3-like [Aristolochia californica]|uniref:histone-lysine N-methyltransferase ASHH3-like n=1 Tax=Aristolochia californica TaxID=171875 RepID=UPI0035D98044